MLLLLDDIHKKHLELLKEVDEKVMREFCRISMDHLIKGSNAKVYQSAAQKLNVEPDIVQNAVMGIMHLLAEASKEMIPELEFRDSIIVLGFNEQCQEELLKCYLENRDEIRAVLTSLNIKIPHYHNLEWRLDVQIASRSLRRPLEPKLLLKLELEQEDSKRRKNVLLEADPTNLVHLTEELERALQEARSHHCRRMMRNIK